MDCSTLTTHEERVECYLELLAAPEQLAAVGALVDFLPVLLVVGIALLAIQLARPR